MAAVAPFNIMITGGPSVNGHFQPSDPVPGGTVSWVSTGPSPININMTELQERLAICANVVINNGTGDIVFDSPLITDINSRLSLVANNIKLATAIFGPNLNLVLTTPGIVMTGMGATLKLGGLTLDVGTGCQIGFPFSGPFASEIGGMTDGSNIVLENTNFGRGTHFFNGTDVSTYILAQKAAKTVTGGKATSSNSAASTATTAATTAAAQPMTVAYIAAAAGSKADTDEAKPDPNKGPSAKAKK